MSSLRWDDVADLFDPELVGSLPDGWVEGTTVDDWQTVLDLLGTEPWRWQVDGHALPTAAELAARDGDPEAEFHPVQVEIAPEAWVNFWYRAADSIDFDIDVRELQGQERLDALCDFLRTVGRALGRSVWVGAEGATNDRMYGYDATLDRVVRLAERWDRQARGGWIGRVMRRRR